MRKLAILFILFFNLDLQAQDTLVTYYDAHWRNTTPDQAAYFGKIYQLNRKLWTTQYFYRGGRLQMQGTITSPKPGGQKQGLYVWYHRNGTPRMRGYFVDDYKIGSWEWWFDNGALAQQGQYNAVGEAIGWWQRWYADGSLDFEGRYRKNRKEGVWRWHHPNGQLSALETYSRGRRLKAAYYSPSGEEIPEHKTNNTAPLFAGGDTGLEDFIKNNLSYPERALEEQIGGKVVVQFYIERDGSVSDPSVLYAAHPLLAQEALRLVQLMPKWQPAMLHNRPALFRYMLPLHFRAN